MVRSLDDSIYNCGTSFREGVDDYFVFNTTFLTSQETSVKKHFISMLNQIIKKK